MTNRIVGKMIREYREKAGLSQAKLGEMVGLAQQSFPPIEQGKRTIGIEHLWEICQVLGFDLVDIQNRINRAQVTVESAVMEDLPRIRMLDSEISEDLLASCIQNKQIYVLRTPSAIMGFLRFCYFQQSIPFLERLYINEANRREGFGKQFLVHWENRMKELDFYRVLISISEQDNNRFFFEKQGYNFAGSFFPYAQMPEMLVYVKELA